MRVRKGYRKYRNVKHEIDGRMFDSRREAMRYVYLRDLERKGVIRDLECQPEYQLSCGDRPILIRSERYKNGRRAKYTPDFRYREAATNRLVLEDAKGMRTPDYALRRAILEAMYPHLRVDEV